MSDNYKQEDECKCLFNEPFFDLDEYIRGKNINFLIGSGASAKVYKTLNIADDLSFEDIISLDWEDFEKQALYLYFYFRVIHPMFDIDKIIKNKTSSISDEFNKVFKYYKTFLKQLYIFLQNESNDTPRRINIFSTNYDLFFEYAYDSISAEFPLSIFNDGSKGIFNKIIDINNFYFNTNHPGISSDYKYSIPTINLLKLHGSISWISDLKTDSKIKNIWNLKKRSNHFSKFYKKFIKNQETPIDKIKNNKKQANIKLEQEINSELKQLLKDETKEEIENKFEKPFDNKSKKQIKSELKKQINYKWEKVNSRFNKSPYNQLEEQINSELKQLLKDEIKKQIENGEKQLNEKVDFFAIIGKELLPHEYKLKKFKEDFESEIKEIIKNKDDLKPFWEKYKTINIINPDKEKFFNTLFQQHYFEALRFFNYELEKQQTILIVFGFSFKDEHIRDIVKRSLFNKKLTVITIPFGPKDYEYINKEFETFENFKYLLCHNSGCKYNKFSNQENGNFAFLLQELFKIKDIE